MSWGEIREELIERAPGLSLDQANRYIRRAYREILDLRDWSGLHQDGWLALVGEYGAGTVALTNASNAVTGTDTVWTSAMSGRKFRLLGSATWYTFTYISPTTATLDRPWEEETLSDQVYAIYQDVYTLPAYVKLVEAMLNMDRLNLIELRERGPIPGECSAWAPANDTNEATPPVLHRIEVWPYPSAARSLPYRYLSAVYEFDGQNTADSPLPWVSVDAIVSGALMRAGVQDGTDYQTFLNRMERVENQRETPRQMQMADRFTEHRRRRLYR